MENRRIISFLSAALLLLTGCSKMPVLSDHPFTIGISSVQAKAVWADVVPETNDFNYNFGTVTVKDYEEIYKTDEALILAKDKEDREYWEKNLKEHISFRDAFLYRGAYFLNGSPLEPETDYYIFAFPYDKDDKPVCKLVKQRFKTASAILSDIDFTVTLNGSVISLVPSNDDTYCFEYETLETVNENFGGSPSLFFSTLIYKYEEYGFMADRTEKGTAESDIAPFYTLTTGMEFYLVASGYNNGVNSPYRMFKLTYVEEGLPGKVEKVEAPSAI